MENNSLFSIIRGRNYLVTVGFDRNMNKTFRGGTKQNEVCNKMRCFKMNL